MVVVTAKVDSTKNVIAHLKDADSFVELVQALMKETNGSDVE